MPSPVVASTAGSGVTSAAAHPSTQPAVKSPTASPTQLPAASPSRAPSSAKKSTLVGSPASTASVTKGAVLAEDELSRTVVSVFGDSAALHLIDAVPVGATKVAAGPVWDINVRSYETHERVTHYVQLFTTTSREHFRERLSRGTRYEPMIRAKLRAGGMPEDLTYLALIESGYDPHAYSRAAAVGLWQFMSSTARDVGMRVDWWVDERRDPARSTEGAIKFLRQLQTQFGSLYLAAAAYNGGPGRVARGLTRYAGEMEGAEGEDRFFALAEQDYLRTETKNYVPQLIAAALLAKVPSRYGLAVDSLPLFTYDSVQAAPYTSLVSIAQASGGTSQQLLELNPALLRGMVPPDGAWWVHVPVGSADRAAEQLRVMPDSVRVGAHSTRIAVATTMAALATRAGISEKQLALYNPRIKVGKRGRVAADQSVMLPTRATVALARNVPDPAIERWGSANAMASRGMHVVRRGETLSGIARKYGLTVMRLKSLNGIRTSRAIPGQALRVRAATTTASRARVRTASGKTTSAKATSGKTASRQSASKSGSKKRVKQRTKKSTKKSGKKRATNPSSKKT